MDKLKEIDIVIPWVDGTNSEWKERFLSYSPIEKQGTEEIRFRDWGLLRYWFRSIEKFAPWVNTIHLITSGEIPEWLNINHPKLNWVKHTDYIPHEYLPTFNANAIEVNIHRIEKLSERFIYFNDDFFLLKETNSERFFYNGLPCDYAVMTAKPASGGIIHMAINDLEIIEKYFDKHTVIKSNLNKWFSPRYGKGLFNNLLLYPWKEFSGFIDPHIPYAFRKSTLSKLWELCPKILEETSLSRFRSNENVNQWLFRYWQIAEGNFYPKNIQQNTLCTDITDTNAIEIKEIIRKQKYDIICLNDNKEIQDFEKCKKIILEGFETLLPQKSSFEKS